jgi:predicted NUDIX family phosphoesterase
MQIQKNQSRNISHTNEEILVISCKSLFSQINSWQGINEKNFNEITKIIHDQLSCMPRAHAETNFAYKQIIPYVLFTIDQKLFVMQRKSSASEQRLASKFSLGIGGHIRQDDIKNNDIFTWALREFHEEVNYQEALSYTAIGILNDDSSDVGKVHLGIIWLIHGSSDQISIKNEHKSGTLLTMQECSQLYENMENWSKICFDFLQKNLELMK